MKTLRLAVLAVLLTSTVMVFANNNNAKNTVSNQQELYNGFKTTLTENGVVEGFESNTTELVVVYCSVDNKSNIVIDKIRSSNNNLVENVLRIMEENPLHASPQLIGQEIAFKLKFEIK